MIIVLKQNAPDAQVHEFCRELEGMGLQINDSKGSDTHILGLIGDTKAIAESWVLANPVVETCRRVSEPYKKANRKFHPDDTRHRRGRREDRRRQLCRHRRPLQHRERGADHLAAPSACKARRCFPAARRRVQAPHLALLLPGHAAARAWTCCKLARAAPPGLPIVTEIMNTEHLPLFDECGPHPGRCPQHAEL